MINYEEKQVIIYLLINVISFPNLQSKERLIKEHKNFQKRYSIIHIDSIISDLIDLIMFVSLR